MIQKINKKKKLIFSQPNCHNFEFEVTQAGNVVRDEDIILMMV